MSKAKMYHVVLPTTVSVPLALTRKGFVGNEGCQAKVLQTDFSP